MSIFYLFIYLFILNYIQAHDEMRKKRAPLSCGKREKYPLFVNNYCQLNAFLARYGGEALANKGHLLVTWNHLRHLVGHIERRVL